MTWEEKFIKLERIVNNTYEAATRDSVNNPDVMLTYSHLAFVLNYICTQAKKIAGEK